VYQNLLTCTCMLLTPPLHPVSPVDTCRLSQGPLRQQQWAGVQQAGASAAGGWPCCRVQDAGSTTSTGPLHLGPAGCVLSTQSESSSATQLHHGMIQALELSAGFGSYGLGAGSPAGSVEAGFHAYLIQQMSSLITTTCGQGILVVDSSMDDAWHATHHRRVGTLLMCGPLLLMLPAVCGCVWVGLQSGTNSRDSSSSRKPFIMVLGV
jgi:hypothetical protein